MKKRIAFMATTILATLAVVNPVHAQSLLPSQIRDIFDDIGQEGSGVAGFVSSRVRTGVFIALGGVILIAVVYALIAAIKYIQSQGDPGKIEEAQKAIKAIFVGIAAMLIAIIGIILVFVFFGSDPINPNLFQTCLSAPNSVGCADCRELGDQVVETPGAPPTYAGGGECGPCETQYAQFAFDGTTQPTGNCIDPINAP